MHTSSSVRVGGLFIVLGGVMGMGPGCSDISGLSSTEGSQLSGAIFTTESTGTVVNGNLYTNKTDVYLDGGPQGNAPCSAAGLPEGYYYFQVTDPPGATLLSSDAVSEREVMVSGGLITAYLGTTHTVGFGKCAGGISVALAPFDDTPNRESVDATQSNASRISSSRGSHSIVLVMTCAGGLSEVLTIQTKGAAHMQTMAVPRSQIGTSAQASAVPGTRLATRGPHLVWLTT